MWHIAYTGMENAQYLLTKISVSEENDEETEA